MNISKQKKDDPTVIVNNYGSCCELKNVNEKLDLIINLLQDGSISKDQLKESIQPRVDRLKNLGKADAETP